MPVYPNETLDMRSAFAFGASLTAAPTSWSWTDCSNDLLGLDTTGVSTVVGRGNLAGQPEPNNALFELWNPDGRYSVDNPMGSHWPNVVQNTPGILAVRRNLNPTFETDASDWSGLHATVARSTTRAFSGTGSLLLTPTGGFTFALALINALMPVRANGAVYVDAWVYSVAGFPSVAVAVDWSDSGGTFISSTEGPTRAIPAGQWTYIAALIGPAPSNAAQFVGKVQMDGSPAVTDLLWVDEARASVPRLCGYVDGWTPSIDVSGKRTTAEVSLSSVRRRSNQGSTPVRSPLRYTIGTNIMKHYWPCEEGANAQSAADAIVGTGQPPLYASGTVGFAGYTPTSAVPSADLVVQYGTKPLPQLSQGGGLSTTFATVGSTAWAVQFASDFDASGNSGGPEVTIAEWSTPGGTHSRWRVTMAGGAGGLFGTSVYTIDGNGTATRIINDAITSTVFREMYVSAGQLGGNINVTLNNAGTTTTAAVTATLAGITGLSINPNLTATSVDFALGHIRVWDTASPSIIEPVGGAGPFLTPAAWNSWSGETAGARVARILSETGTQAATVADQSVSMAMGPQPVSALQQILSDCETTDGGLIHDPHDSFGTGYVVRTDLYNQVVALSADMPTGQVMPPFKPVQDDALRVNHAIVSSSQRNTTFEYVGDLSQGEYPRSVSANTADSSVLQFVPGWLVNVGTPRQALRYPTLTLNFAAAPALINAWLAMPPAGARVQVTNVPGTVGVNTVDLMVVGWAEAIGQKVWQVALNCVPYDPWRVGALAATGDGRWRLEAAGSTLAAGVNSSATTLSVATSAGNALWSTSGADYSSDIYIDGERITVTVVTGPSSPQTMTVTRSVNGVVKSLASGAAVTLWRAPTTAL